MRDYQAYVDRESADVRGQILPDKEAYCEPKPVQKPYPPFVIGGGGEKLTLRIVAQYASIWNFVVGSTTEEFRRKSSILESHCAAIERDPQTIQRSIQPAVNLENLAETRDFIRDYIEARATHIILNLRVLNTPYPEGIIQRLDEEVIRPLK